MMERELDDINNYAIPLKSVQEAQLSVSHKFNADRESPDGPTQYVMATTDEEVM